jgi:hypothetical protein
VSQHAKVADVLFHHITTTGTTTLKTQMHSLLLEVLLAGTLLRSVGAFLRAVRTRFDFLPLTAVWFSLAKSIRCVSCTYAGSVES